MLPCATYQHVPGFVKNFDIVAFSDAVKILPLLDWITCCTYLSNKETYLKEMAQNTLFFENDTPQQAWFLIFVLVLNGIETQSYFLFSKDKLTTSLFCNMAKTDALPKTSKPAKNNWDKIHFLNEL